MDLGWKQARARRGEKIARMADGGGAKRLKSSEGGDDVISEVLELRRENAELRRRNAELEAENEQLRWGGRQGGDHEALPVVVESFVTTAVDLSRVDASIVTQVSSFIGSSRELLNLALTCKSFGWRQPTASLNWSLAEEVARQAVCSRATDADMSSLPRYVGGTTTWLSILHRFELPLMFDLLLGDSIEYDDGDKTTVRGTSDYFDSTAVSSGYVMSSGAHFAQFQITGSPTIGVVRPMPDLDAGAYKNRRFHWLIGDLSPIFLAQKSDDWGDGNVHACGYSGGNGGSWTNWDDEKHWHLNWDGKEDCKTGDILGMLLNLDDGTLTVYKNNRRLGVMKDGLSGPYCWYAEVTRDYTVTIKRGTPPNRGDAVIV